MPFGWGKSKEAPAPRGEQRGEEVPRRGASISIGSAGEGDVTLEEVMSETSASLRGAHTARILRTLEPVDDGTETHLERVMRQNGFSEEDRILTVHTLLSEARGEETDLLRETREKRQARQRDDAKVREQAEKERRRSGVSKAVRRVGRGIRTIFSSDILGDPYKPSGRY